MRVLMLGWEFPPFISGGLGTACYGLTRALSELGAEILFVLPRPVPSTVTRSTCVCFRRLKFWRAEVEFPASWGSAFSTVRFLGVDAVMYPYGEAADPIRPWC